MKQRLGLVAIYLCMRVCYLWTLVAQKIAGRIGWVIDVQVAAHPKPEPKRPQLPAGPQFITAADAAFLADWIGPLDAPEPDTV